MRLRKIEFVLLAVAALSVVRFASWLQNEMDRAARVRDQREFGESRGNCAEEIAAGMLLDHKGSIWCGVVNREPLGQQEKRGA